MTRGALLPGPTLAAVPGGHGGGADQQQQIVDEEPELPSRCQCDANIRVCRPPTRTQHQQLEILGIVGKSSTNCHAAQDRNDRFCFARRWWAEGSAHHCLAAKKECQRVQRHKQVVDPERESQVALIGKTEQIRSEGLTCGRAGAIAKCLRHAGKIVGGEVRAVECDQQSSDENARNQATPEIPYPHRCSCGWNCGPLNRGWRSRRQRQLTGWKQRSV